MDEVYLKIAGKMMYLWRAVDAEDEVLDVLDQSRRAEQAALKLIRKLLKKYAMAPDRLVTDALKSYGATARDQGLRVFMSKTKGRTIERRIRINQRDDASSICSA